MSRSHTEANKRRRYLDRGRWEDGAVCAGRAGLDLFSPPEKMGTFTSLGEAEPLSPDIRETPQVSALSD